MARDNGFSKIILFRRTKWGEDLPVTKCDCFRARTTHTVAHEQKLNIAFGHSGVGDTDTMVMNSHFPVFAKAMPLDYMEG